MFSSSGDRRSGKLERGNGPCCSSCNCLVHLLASWHEPLGHSSQVLRSRCHQEFIMGAAWTPQSQTVQLQNAFKMGKEHFHLFSLTARFLVFRRLRNTPRFVTRSFMDAAGDLAEWCIRTAAIFHRTVFAVELACPIDDRVSLRDA